MAKFGRFKKMLKLLLIILIIAVLLIVGIPFVASALQTKSLSSAVSTASNPIRFWKSTLRV